MQIINIKRGSIPFFCFLSIVEEDSCCGGDNVVDGDNDVIDGDSVVDGKSILYIYKCFYYRILFSGFFFFFSHRFFICSGLSSFAVLGVSFVIRFNGRQ